ncbi:MAG: GIY-YIG nuclease family protein [Gammaproteobacteria bacterium]|nr:GIY-YIG nuclease family protein [Gammaproteobacteria bacterium]
MADPFTIRIFVPDGDPEGVRLIDRMNWTGLGLVFRRSDWPEVRKRREMRSTGIYVLVGYRSEDDDLPTLYIGQADGVRGRIDSHHKDKEFWDWAAVFVSTSGGLNRAHVTWLEYALVNRAVETRRCLLDNGNVPQEPALTEAEKADTHGFMKEILQILPLVGLRAFEFPKAVAAPLARDPLTGGKPSGRKRDTIIVPAQKDGFEEVFLGEDSWYAIRISGGMLGKIKYIAAYRTQPVSAITHYAPVSLIEPYGEGGKYKVVFSESAKSIGPIPFGDAHPGAMQSPRYTSFARLQKAKKLTDILGKH